MSAILGQISVSSLRSGISGSGYDCVILDSDSKIVLTGDDAEIVALDIEGQGFVRSSGNDDGISFDVITYDRRNI